MTEQELKDLHKLVWNFRSLAAEYWPTPNPDDALDYAFTEVGEAFDARLREKRPNDKRNRDKDHDRLDEWADCAIMLITALPGDSHEWSGAVLHRWDISDRQLAFRVVHHLFGKGAITVTIGRIGDLPGIDLLARVRNRLIRIMYKHVPAWKWGEFTAVLGELTTPPWERDLVVPKA